MMTRNEIVAGMAVLVIAVVIGALFDRFVLVVSWWPLVGRDWWQERRTGMIGYLPGPADQRSPEYAQTGTARRVGEPDWDDLDPDAQADQLIAEWHAEPQERLTDRNTWNWQADPDLIVWDAKQQARRCWEIVHVEFPRLRAELGLVAA